MSKDTALGVLNVLSYVFVAWDGYYIAGRLLEGHTSWLFVPGLAMIVWVFRQIGKSIEKEVDRDLRRED